MRASDADRQRAVEELRRHCAAGRIDVDEYASRIERVLGASTLEDLDDIRADLPIMRVADPGAGRGVWASSRPDTPRLPVPLSGDEESSAGATARMRAAAVVIAVVSVMVVIAAIAMAFAAEWVWAALLLAGWLAGVLQGRSGGRTPRR